MNLLLKAKQTFLKCFCDMIKISLYNSLNIVVILNPGRELFSVRSAQFPLTFKE